MKRTQILQYLVLGGIAIVILGVAVAFVVSPREGGRELSQGDRAAGDGLLPVIKVLDQFSLTNQVGQTVSVSSLKGRPWVANIFFSRCPSFCAQMTRRMKEIQDSLPEDSPLQLVSITTDPDYDLPEVLDKYARRNGAEEGRWHFLTGTRSEIGHAIQKELLLAMKENAEGERQSELDLFTHSSLIVLVDAESRLRATYESLGTNRVDSLIADLNKL